MANFGLIGASINFGTTFASSMAQNAQTRAYNKAMADTYRTQARLGLLSSARENRYENEELGYQVWNLRDNANSFISSQETALASSGFSMSTGDKRLFADTERKAMEQNTEMNRQAYLDTFERFQQAYLNKIQYDAQAKIADINRKYASGWRGFNTAFTNAGLSALGSYFQFAQPSGSAKNVGVQGGMN